MGNKAWKVATATLAAALLVIGYDAVAFASTGSSLILGRLNRAAGVTTVQRTTSGPAMMFKTAGGAPFAVSSARKVRKLNADKVDGYQGKALATDTVSYADTDAVTQFDAAAAYWTFPVPAAGDYRVDITGELFGLSGSSDTESVCFLVHVNDAHTTFLDYPMVVSAPMAGDSIPAELSGSRAVHLAATGDYLLGCQVTDGSATHKFTIGARNPLQLSLTRITSLTSSNQLTYSPVP